MSELKHILITLAFLCSSVMGWSQTPKDTLRVLFVGNSYTYYENMPQLVSLLSDSTNTKLITTQSTIGGSHLREHWLGLRGLKTKERIQNGNFDMVVLQEHSMGAIRTPDSLKKYARLLSNFSRNHNVTPYLYLTWAREKQPQYQKTINNVFAAVATQNNAVLVPVGNVWYQSKQLRPDLKIHAPDGSHPSRLGAYLTACVFVAKLTNELPKNFRTHITTITTGGATGYLMELPTKDVAFFKSIVKAVMEQ